MPVITDSIIVMTNKKHIGAFTLISWKDKPELNLGRYFSFGEQITDKDGDVVSDSYSVSDNDIFFYCSEAEFLDIAENGSTNDDHHEFVIKEYQLVESFVKHMTKERTK